MKKFRLKNRFVPLTLSQAPVHSCFSCTSPAPSKAGASLRLLAVSQQKLPLHHLLIECLAFRIRRKREEHLSHVHDLRLIQGKLTHDPIADVAPRDAVHIILIIPPAYLLYLQDTLESLPVYGERKRHVSVMHS
jgi:hypothetical protein